MSVASEITRHKKPRRPFFDVLNLKQFWIVGSKKAKKQKDEERSHTRPRGNFFENVFWREQKSQQVETKHMIVE